MPVCRQNTIGSVEGELRSHEFWEIQVDSFLKLERVANKHNSTDSDEVVPIGYFLFEDHRRPISGLCLID